MQPEAVNPWLSSLPAITRPGWHFKECTGAGGSAGVSLFYGGGNTSLPSPKISGVGPTKLLLRGCSSGGRQEILNSVGPAVTFAKRKTLLNTIVDLKIKKNKQGPM